MSLVVDEHRELLDDPVRLAAFGNAIHEVVRAGDVVLDLGSGTGILGLMACRAGASHVFSIEAGGMLGLARDICRANGFEGRMTFVQGMSNRVQLPERVDVVVADQIGRLGIEAGLIQYFSDARERLLRPDGTLIPSQVDLWLAAVEAPEMWRRIEFWGSAPAGFDFSPARMVALNTGYPVQLQAEDLLCEPATVASLDMRTITPTPLTWDASFAVRRSGTMHGIVGWFVARLSRTVWMSNSPLSAARIKRSNAFFPVEAPVAVTAGETVRVRMHVIPNETTVSWVVEVFGIGERSGNAAAAKPRTRSSHSTFRGLLLSREALERTRPEFKPRLTPLGEARRFVLEGCDGRRSLSEIERDLHRRHPGLFASLDDAAAFVAEVVTRYSE